MGEREIIGLKKIAEDINRCSKQARDSDELLQFSDLREIIKNYLYGEGGTGCRRRSPARKNLHGDGVDVSKEIARSNIPAVLSADVNSPM